MFLYQEKGQVFRDTKQAHRVAVAQEGQNVGDKVTDQVSTAPSMALGSLRSLIFFYLSEMKQGTGDIPDYRF